MPILLIVEKTGTVKELAVKSYVEADLYKKGGFKSANEFNLHHVFPVTLGQTAYRIHVYGKAQGKAGQENKYDFPPPIDHTLFFGSCVLVNHDEHDDVVNLTKLEWARIYEKLFGGFEAVDDSDGEDYDMTSEEERILLDPATKFTATGYVKDDFIVDDDDSLGEDAETLSASEEEEEAPPKKAAPKKKKAAPAAAAGRGKRASKREVKEEPDNSSIMECQDELTEEEYFK